jgi:hypothetical protein
MVTLVCLTCLFDDWLPDGGGALLGEDLEHEEAVHGRARPVQEGDQTTATSREQGLSFQTASKDLGLLGFSFI